MSSRIFSHFVLESMLEQKQLARNMNSTMVHAHILKSVEHQSFMKSGHEIVQSDMNGIYIQRCGIVAG